MRVNTTCSLTLKRSATNPETQRTPLNPDDPPVTVQPLRFAGQAPPQVAQWVMEGALQAWFITHLEDFTHVFAIVALNRKVDHDGFQWLAPQYTGYAYIDGLSGRAVYDAAAERRWIGTPAIADSDSQKGESWVSDLARSLPSSLSDSH